jgi:hypothetical protein
MPSGGITADGFEWLHTHPKYFAPVSELSKKFKTEYLTALNIEKQNLKLSCDDTQWNDLMQDCSKRAGLCLHSLLLLNPIMSLIIWVITHIKLPSRTIA